ncbi:hypothetical protein [Candidatus Parabeggiatoa sp. HSG14]|uniref:hypothetical protein n=1 Tax=Candidatus Parabeggiatoa sp. HSG14 TaxID=3055593 RepID=UPI0025A7A059|nr:hypothetical protein [Thiotrichales bacterium HSG14]
MAHKDEFTDRVELLRKLEQWVKAIGRITAIKLRATIKDCSQKIFNLMAVSPMDRKNGLILLDRLVNSVFFKPEYQVIPFYFKMKREKRTLKKFGIRHDIF